MTRLYFCSEEERESALHKLLARECDGQVKIERKEGGKPFCSGAHFNISHSGGRCVIAISGGEVGVDMEVLCGRNCSAVLHSFSPRERAEIKDERDFLVHWTAREAYAKFLGEGIWKYAKRLEFFGGTLYLDGAPVEQKTEFCHLQNAVVAVCTENGGYAVCEI